MPRNKNKEKQTLGKPVGQSFSVDIPHISVTEALNRAMNIEGGASWQSEYDLAFENIPGMLSTRVRLSKTGEPENFVVRDLMWDRPTSDMWGGPSENRTLRMLYKGNPEQGAGIFPQIEASQRFSWDNPDYQYTSSARVAVRAFMAALSAGKSPEHVLSQGSRRYRVASHRDEGDYGASAAGGSGVLSYHGESLRNSLMGRVNLLMPNQVGNDRVLGQINMEEKYLDSIRTSINTGGGSIANTLSYYALRTSAKIPFLQEQLFDVREYEKAGIKYRTAFAHIGFDSEGHLTPKNIKHDQAGTGPRRETAFMMDSNWNRIAPKPFEFSLSNVGGRGRINADYTQYAELSGRYGAWERPDRPRHAALARLQLIPENVPFSSGAEKYDPRAGPDMGNIAMEQRKYITLDDIRTPDQLMRLAEDPKFFDQVVKAGQGSQVIATLGGKDIRLSRKARDMFVTGRSMQIAPWYNPNRNPEKESQFISMQSQGAISTESLANYLSEKLGITVTRHATTSPQFIADMYAKVDYGLKGFGGKAGDSPIVSGLPISVDIGGQRINAGGVGSEVKSMPLMMSQSFLMFDRNIKANWAGLLKGKGSRLFADWVRNSPDITPDMAIEDYAAKWSEFSGGDKRNWVDMIGQMTEGILGQKSGAATLQEYGFTPVNKPQWVNWDLMSEGEVALTRASMRQIGLSEADEGKKFRFKKTDNGQYQASFFMERGLLGFASKDIVPELQGRGILNYRQYASLAQYFPDTFKSLIGDVPQETSTDPRKAGWNQLMRWYAYDSDARYHRYRMLPSEDVSRTINATDAERISALMAEPSGISGLSPEMAKKIAGTTGPVKWTDKERMQLADLALKTALPGYRSNQMLYEPNSNIFLPGPSTVAAIDNFNLSGESTGLASKSWGSAFEKFLFSTSDATGIDESIKAVYGFRKMAEKRLGGKGVAKNVFGYDAPGMVFERYSAAEWLAPNEIYLSHAELERSIESTSPSRKDQQRLLKGMVSDLTPNQLYMASKYIGNEEGLAKALMGAYNYSGSNLSSEQSWGNALSDAKNWLSETERMRNAFMPGFMFRQPDVSRWGVIPAKLISESQAAARGIDPTSIKGLSSAVSNYFSSIGIGDKDKDPLQFFMTLARGEKGLRPSVTPEMQKYFDAFDQMRSDMGSVLGPQEIDPIAMTKQMFGVGDAAAYNIVASQLQGYITGKNPAFLKGVGTGRQVPIEEFSNAMKQTGKQKRMMGVVYNAMRALEASQAGVGIYGGASGGKTYTENIFHPLQSNYQRAIDISLDEGNAMFNILNTSRFFFKNTADIDVGKGKYPDQMYLGFSAKGIREDATDWRTAISSKSGSGQGLLNKLVTAMSESRTSSGSRTFRNETLAGLFSATEDQFGKNLAALNEYDRLVNAGDPLVEGKQRWEVLSGGFANQVGVGGSKNEILAAAAASENSIFPTAVMSAATFRSIGEAEKYQPIVNNMFNGSYKFWWGGERRTIADIASMPNVFLSNALLKFQKQTGVGLTSASDIAKSFGALRKVTAGALGLGPDTPLTPDIVKKMPLVSQYFLSSMRGLLGETDYLRYAEGPGPIEGNILEVARREAVGSLGRAIGLKAQSTPEFRTSLVAQYAAGYQRSSPAGKLALQRLYGQEKIDAVYGKYAGDNTANIFEANWKGPGRQTPGVGEDAAWVNTGGMTAGKYIEPPSGASLTFGARLTASPDYSGYDPGSDSLLLNELKMSPDTVYHESGRIQNSIYASILQKVAAEAPDVFNEKIGNVLYPSDSSMQSRVLEAAKAGRIRTFFTSGQRQGDGFSYSVPVEYNWRDTLAKYGGKIESMVKALGGKDPKALAEFVRNSGVLGLMSSRPGSVMMDEGYSLNEWVRQALGGPVDTLAGTMAPASVVDASGRAATATGGGNRGGGNAPPRSPVFSEPAPLGGGGGFDYSKFEKTMLHVFEQAHKLGYMGSRGGYPGKGENVPAKQAQISGSLAALRMVASGNDQELNEFTGGFMNDLAGAGLITSGQSYPSLIDAIGAAGRKDPKQTGYFLAKHRATIGRLGGMLERHARIQANNTELPEDMRVALYGASEGETVPEWANTLYQLYGIKAGLKEAMMPSAEYNAINRDRSFREKIGSVLGADKNRYAVSELLGRTGKTSLADVTRGEIEQFLSARPGLYGSIEGIGKETRRIGSALLRLQTSRPEYKTSLSPNDRAVIDLFNDPFDKPSANASIATFYSSMDIVRGYYEAGNEMPTGVKDPYALKRAKRKLAMLDSSMEIRGAYNKINELSAILPESMRGRIGNLRDLNRLSSSLDITNPEHISAQEILPDIAKQHYKIQESVFRAEELSLPYIDISENKYRRLTDYISANAAHMSAIGRASRVPGWRQFGVAMADETANRMGLYSNLAKARRSTTAAREELAQMYGIAPTEVPTSINALNSWVSTLTEMSPEQEAGISAYKTTLDERSLTLSALRREQSSRERAPWQGNINARDVKSLKEFNTEIDRLSSLLQGGTRHTHEFNQQLVNMQETTKRLDLDRISNAIGSIVGVDATKYTPAQLRRMAVSEAERISGDTSATGVARYQALMSLSEQSGSAQFARDQAQNAINFTREDYGLGGVARRAFGGFGLMYLRGIGSNIMSPLTMGYQERVAQEQQAYAAFAPATGVNTYVPTEQREAFLRGVYGGGSYTELTSRIQSRLLERHPGIQTAGEIAKSATFGAAGALWLSSLTPALAGVAMPMAAAGAAIAGLGVYGAGIYSAYSDTDQTAVGISARSFVTGRTAAERLTGSSAWSYLGEGLSKQGMAYGWAAGRFGGEDPQLIRDVKVLEKVRDDIAINGMSIDESLAEQGIVNRGDIDRYKSMYTRASYATGNIGGSFESYAGAWGIQSRYGLPSSDAYLGNLTSSLQAGMQPEQMAISMGQAVGFSTSMNIMSAGGLISSMTQPNIGAILNAELSKIYETGAQRYSQLGPLAGMGDKARTPEEIREQLGALGKNVGVREMAIFQRAWQMQEQRALWGLIDPKKIKDPARMLDQYGFSRTPNDLDIEGYLRLYSGQEETLRYMSEQGRLRESLALSGKSNEEIAEILRDLESRYPSDQPKSLRALRRLSERSEGVNAVAEALASGRWRSEEEAKSWQRRTTEELLADREDKRGPKSIYSIQDEVDALRLPEAAEFSQTNLQRQAAVLRRDPTAISWANVERLQVADVMTKGPPWWMVSQDIGQFGPLAGRPTGQRLFATSMQWGLPGATTQFTGPDGKTRDFQTGLSPEAVMLMLFGKDWESRGQGTAPRGALDAQGRPVNSLLQGMFAGIQFPFNIPGTNQPYVEGGLGALNQMMAQSNYQAQMASIGISMAGLNLQYAFTTGVNLDQYAGIVNPQTGQPFGINTGGYKWNVPGVGSYGNKPGEKYGGFWGLEDASRALGYAQQEWSFGMQQRQLDMSARFFNQNMGLQLRQTEMQRGWQQQDWAYQSETRAMQWKWRQEEFGEEVRFMTGRERKKAERQMGHETILYNLEGEQIDKQKQRQKELWKLEDERFQVQKQQHEESLALQREALKVNMAFYEERKKLEAEQIKLQRAMWTEQMKLQRAALGVQAEQARKQKEYQDIMTAVDKMQALMLAAQETGATNTKDYWYKMLDYLKLVDSELAKMIQAWLNGKYGNGAPQNQGLPPAQQTGGVGGGIGGGGIGTWNPGTNPTNPPPASGGVFNGSPTMFKQFSSGGYVVPPGYPNDRFQLWASSGERVTVTPRWATGATQTSELQNPWANTLLSPTSPMQGSGGPTTIILNIGDQHLKTFVVDALEGALNA